MFELNHVHQNHRDKKIIPLVLESFKDWQMGQAMTSILQPRKFMYVSISEVAVRFEAEAAAGPPSLELLTGLEDAMQGLFKLLDEAGCKPSFPATQPAVISGSGSRSGSLPSASFASSSSNATKAAQGVVATTGSASAMNSSPSKISLSPSPADFNPPMSPKAPNTRQPSNLGPRAAQNLNALANTHGIVSAAATSASTPDAKPPTTFKENITLIREFFLMNSNMSPVEVVAEANKLMGCEPQGTLPQQAQNLLSVIGI